MPDVRCAMCMQHAELVIVVVVAVVSCFKLLLVVAAQETSLGSVVSLCPSV